MREILRLKQLTERLPLTKHQVYHLIRRSDHPLPYRKIGKTLLFDWSRVEAWFQSLPGKDVEE